MQLNNNTIMIADSKGVSVIGINSIVRVEAVNNYSKLFLTDGKTVMACMVLKRMEAVLAGKGFERTHRSHLVNTACIKRYNLSLLTIELHNADEIAISRRRRTGIRKKLSEKKAFYLNQRDADQNYQIINH